VNNSHRREQKNERTWGASKKSELSYQGGRGGGGAMSSLIGSDGTSLTQKRKGRSREMSIEQSRWGEMPPRKAVKEKNLGKAQRPLETPSLVPEGDAHRWPD